MKNDKYSKMFDLANKIFNEIEDEISDMELKNEFEFNFWVKLKQRCDIKIIEVDGTSYTSGQPG